MEDVSRKVEVWFAMSLIDEADAPLMHTFANLTPNAGAWLLWRAPPHHQLHDAHGQLLGGADRDALHSGVTAGD